MKVIDLKKQTIYVDDIEQIYIDDSYSKERYFIQTRYGTYLVDKDDYFKVKNYLLSLNDEVEIIEEDKKIKNIEYDRDCTVEWDFKELYDKVNEIIDKVNKGE